MLSEDEKSLKIKESQAGKGINKQEVIKKDNKETRYKDYNSIENLEGRGVFYFGGTGGGFIAPNS